ncbi:hypothetical protein H109_07250 [Trichophyton interdigitale MR816]|uniref:Uncharacterized protein n=1 Tax=Trichophyton interdigitale (strain MR816) TaxID=1215338 RepID=A0A059IZW6_TRIIM|nr:hypothetical protein H109_07250 [Trichophyton interdigitale MR816]
MKRNSIVPIRWPCRRIHLLFAFLVTTVIYFYIIHLAPSLIPLKAGSFSALPDGGSGRDSNNQDHDNGLSGAEPAIPPTKHDDDAVEMVVASMKRENVTWLHEYLPQWKKNIYVVDDPEAELTVPENKGREAMVYLTYIIDRYDSLPANIFFHHAERFQWHNDNPDYDALTLLQSFRLSYLKKEGYVNLRCDWSLGCPLAIRPSIDATQAAPGEGLTCKHIYKQAFEELFPGETIPETVGVGCCSQFAVRRETIRLHPKADYIRYREWLTDSKHDDGLSGRVLEYAWHLIFGKEAVHCPDAGMCYCEAYGLCDMDCNVARCVGQYTLPRYSTLPQGWPKVGWNGEDRHWSGPE